MSQENVYEVPDSWQQSAHADNDKYLEMYRHSINDPEGFWAQEGKSRIDWIAPFSKIKDVSYGPGDVHIKWFEDGTLNVAANCIDRHLETRGDQTAIIWEGDEPDQHQHISYKQLHIRVCKFANVLKSLGAKKGDRITIYMPMIPEAAYAMLACARIGAVHSVVFGGFSPDALAGRITDCDSNIVITADEGVRGGRKVPLKANTDEAIAKCPMVEKVLVVKRTNADVNWVEGRDHWLGEEMDKASVECPPEVMNAEDPLFILYTSGSTGKPKGVLHTSGGYLVYAAMTHHYVFDYHDGDIYWCTADVGWITGHSYIVYGPLANGAVHSVVFGGFSPDALAGRITDCDSNIVITADEGVRGGRKVPLKANTDEAIAKCPMVEKVLVVKRTNADVNWVEGRDHWLGEEMDKASVECPPEVMNAEDPLFILYTSGSTGKPKGVLHTSGGYLVYAAMTHHYVFDYHDGDIYWCTADVGWITGHSYIVYGPLANGATTLMFEGVPNYPDASRFWQVCDKHNVNIFYTAPTALRALMGAGNKYLEKTRRTSLKLLGTVGEPINPEAWEWYYHQVGGGRCPIVDTWWQTETGGIMITALPGATKLKPGSATRPFFGVKPALVDADGNQIEGPGQGNLVILDSWPGQMRSLYGDHERFIQTYFSTYDGMYFTSDGCRRDEDGFYWITGRVDDVLNVSGHRMGTAEVESALVAHDKVSEAAVVGYPHDIKGQGIYVYVTLMAGETPSDELKTELRNWVRKEIGPIASPDLVQFAPGLPKTRSGKIMRRILRKIAEDDFSNLGDTSTLAEPAVVEDLIENRQNRG